jgi:hypothetical protein
VTFSVAAASGFWLSTLLAQVISPQGTMPTDAGLRTAYCLRVIQLRQVQTQMQRRDFEAHLKKVRDELHGMSANDPALGSKKELERTWIKLLDQSDQSSAQYKTVQDRLKAYLEATYRSLDPTAILEAQKRGQSDLIASDAIANDCASKCERSEKTPAGTESCFQSCIYSHSELPLRTGACAHPTWLPPGQARHQDGK